jgi:hypothetical protein
MPEDEKYEIEYGQGISDEDYLDVKSQGTRRKPFGPKRSAAEVENRVQRLYKRQLEGLPCRQLVLDHADKEQIGLATAWRDWKKVQTLNNEDFKLERDTMAGRIFSMRTRLFNSSLKRGQTSTAAQILDSLARMIGCDEPTQTGASVPEIRITVESPNKDTTK